VEALTGILLCAFCTLFLLYDGKQIWSWVVRLFPATARDALIGAGPKVWGTLTGYVRGTVIVAFIDAACIGVGIFLLDVPMAVPLAVVIFLSSFVPLVGAVASGAIAVIVALVTEGPFTALMVLAVVLAVQQIEGHILQPFILGRAVRVHPLAVVLSVAAGSHRSRNRSGKLQDLCTSRAHMVMWLGRSQLRRASCTDCSSYPRW